MRPIAFLDRLWHHYVKGHEIVYHAATAPDEVMRDGSGRPLINVYNQIEFAVPVAHYECNCGTVWMA